MTLTNKRKRISGILLVFAAIACIMMGVWNVHKTAAAVGEFECSETKCLLSNDKTGMLIATAIKNYDYVYEIGYEFTKGSASENDFTATDRYFREISKGGKSVTAGDIFGLNYADAALAVWEITYDSNIEYEFKFYAKVGKLGSDGQTVVKQDPEQIVYGKTKNVVTYTEVKHYIRNINGSYTLKETETNVPCMGTPSAKTYAGYEYGSNIVNGSVCNMYYELEGVTFYSANNIYKWKPDVSSYQIIDGGATTYNSEYRPATKKIETISQSGEGAYFGIDGIGDKAGKYFVFAIKNAFTAIDPTVPQCNNAGNATINYFDANGNVITYDKNTTDWYVAAIKITEALAANGNVGLDFFSWSAGTAIVGDYAFITQEQFLEFFGTTYSAVNHYVRMGDGSFALKDSETDVTCVGTPETKSYANRVYSSMTITDTVCDMFYEFDGITFNSANDIYKWKGVVASYRVIDGGAMAYDGKYRPTTKKIETISQSAEGAYFGIDGIGDKAGKYLVFAIKNAFTAIDPTVPQCNNAGNATINYFDANGNVITYDKNTTDWYVAAIKITEALAANGNIGLDFFCWSAGAVTIGEYAFVTQEQLNLLGYYSGSETSDIQVNGWVAPESYSDDMLEKIAAAGLTSVSFAAAGTQYIAPADLSASKDIIKQYAKYGINVYTVGGIDDFASIGDFANYGNVLGLMLDEPNKSQIDEIAAAVDTFNLANVGKKVLIVNLFPSYASAVTSGFSTYSAYLQYLYDNVLSKLKCELWISVDRYPIVRDAKGNPTLDSGWLDDVEAVATFAKANGLKKNFFIQTMPYGSGGFNDSHDRTPTKEDITLQYYVLLAYGYDSISLFCLGTPAPDGTTFLDGQNAMINRNNETTDIYTAVKEVNEELNKFDFILNRFSWDAAVLKTSSLLTSVQAKKIGLKDISSTKNALFSHLVDETRGREAYCVVNYNDTSLNYTNTITLTFSGETILTIIQNGGFRTVTSTSGEFTFTLGVGESIIVIK